MDNFEDFKLDYQEPVILQEKDKSIKTVNTNSIAKNILNPKNVLTPKNVLIASGVIVGTVVAVALGKEIGKVVRDVLITSINSGTAKKGMKQGKTIANKGLKTASYAIKQMERNNRHNSNLLSNALKDSNKNIQLLINKK